MKSELNQKNREMCEDLSSFELDQIDRVEAKYHEISKKNSEKLFEEKFKEVALAITQLYTSVGKFYKNIRDGRS